MVIETTAFILPSFDTFRTRTSVICILPAPFFCPLQVSLSYQCFVGRPSLQYVTLIFLDDYLNPMLSYVTGFPTNTFLNKMEFSTAPLMIHPLDTRELITGFPGETREDHEELMRFVDDCEFDRLGVFTYSPEEDTPAAGMPDQIPEEVKEDRRAELMELQQEIAFDKADAMTDRILEVMVEGQVADENAYVCRTYKDAPGVDGYLFLNTDETLMSGDFAKVRVTGAVDYDLIGELA